MNPVRLFHQLTKDIIQQNQLTVPVQMALKGLYLTHLVWWAYKKKKTYMNKENTLALAGGHFLNWTVGDGWIRTGAKLLYIITRLEDCREQIFLFGEEFVKLRNCLRGRYPIIIKPDWSRKPRSFSLVSPVTRCQRRTSQSERRLFYFRLWDCVGKIFQRLATLGMHMWDAYDSFFVTNEAMNEVFVNGIKWLDKLSANREEFVDRLNKHKPLVQKLLVAMNAKDLTADQLITSVDSGLKALNRGTRTVQQASLATGDTVADFFKRMTAYYFASLNLAKYLPDELVPQERTPWERV